MLLDMETRRRWGREGKMEGENGRNEAKGGGGGGGKRDGIEWGQHSRAIHLSVIICICKDTK